VFLNYQHGEHMLGRDLVSTLGTLSRPFCRLFQAMLADYVVNVPMRILLFAFRCLCGQYMEVHALLPPSAAQCALGVCGWSHAYTIFYISPSMWAIYGGTCPLATFGGSMCPWCVWVVPLVLYTFVSRCEERGNFGHYPKFQI